MNEQYFLLNVNLYEELLQYLNKLPYGEVAVMIRQLQSLPPVKPQIPENGQPGNSQPGS